MRRHAIFAVLVAFVVNARPALACGPYFPNAYFAFASEREVLRLPEPSFYDELRHALQIEARSPAPRYDEIEMRARTRDADANDLAEALKATDTAGDEAASIIEAYRAVSGRADVTDTGDLLKKLPHEFALYAEGASLYRAKQFNEAEAKWKAILALPAEQRRYKSVWAAYMLGRTLRDADPDAAVAAFEKTRALALEGFADPLDLAGESLGWQAYVEKMKGNTQSAIRLYAAQFKQWGSSSVSAYLSLNMLTGKIFDSADALTACAKDETCRAIVTAWVVSHPNSLPKTKSWLATLLSGGDPANVPQADMLAWSAYAAGDFDTARKMLEAPSAATPYGKWVRCKLMLRDGQIDEAVNQLRELAYGFPETEDRAFHMGFYSVTREEVLPVTLIQGELGVLLLGRQNYVEAFDSLLHAGFWMDAAYICDRVLTIDEFKRYVDEHASDPDLSTPIGAELSRADVIRYTLARRLARVGRLAEAAAYYPPSLQDAARKLASALEAGKANEPPEVSQGYWDWFLGRKPLVVVDRRRAEQLFAAAKLTREQGMELLGTETAPDWHIFEGMFELPGYWGPRTRWEGPAIKKFGEGSAPVPEKLADELERVLAASENEKQRIAESAPKPNRRFHYRAVAADLMWQAAQLLPNNDVETMRALYLGGRYLSSMGDYLGANKFYRSLVWRNLNMPYAQEADRKRWFPAKPPA